MLTADLFARADLSLDSAMLLMMAATMAGMPNNYRSSVKRKPREEAWREYRRTGKRYK